MSVLKVTGFDCDVGVAATLFDSATRNAAIAGPTKQRFIVHPREHRSYHHSCRASTSRCFREGLTRLSRATGDHEMRRYVGWFFEIKIISPVLLISCDSWGEPQQAEGPRVPGTSAQEP